MRFGCCGNLIATGPDKTGIEFIDLVAKSGYDYMELPLAEMMDLSDDDFEALKQRVAGSGIRCESCNNFFPARIRLTGPNADFDAAETYFRVALKRAEELGVSVVIFGSGGAKKVPEGFSHQEAFEQVVTITGRIAPVAKAHGITIAIEPIRMPDCNIINTFEEGVQLAKRVGHESIKVLIDYYHMVCQHESPKILLQYGEDYLRHVHFSYPHIPEIDGERSPDPIRHLNEAELDQKGWWRTFPSSPAEWDYGEFIGALNKIGYSGRVSIEAGATDTERQVKEGIAFLRANF